MAEKNMDADINVEFEESASRQQLNSGESVVTLFGKIKKFFTDLKAVAFSGSYNDLSDKPAEYELPTAAKGTLGGVTTSSTVTSSSGYTACPIISGIVYYKDTNTYPSQSNTGDNAEYRLLLSYYANDTSYSNVATLRKSSSFLANPYTGTLTATTFKGDLDGDASTVNGHSVGVDVPADAKFTDSFVGGNLLDNPDFKINQRGVSGTVSAEGGVIQKFVDRWVIFEGSATINSDGTITLNGTMVQYLENAVGTDVVASSSAGTANYDDSLKMYVLSASGEVISWAKLEHGSAATPFIVPDPVEELLKCQRYCVVVPSGRYFRASFVGTSVMQFLLPLPVSMVNVPSIVSGTMGVIPLNLSTAAQADTSFTFSFTGIKNNILTVQATKSNSAIDGALFVTEELVLSADL